MTGNPILIMGGGSGIGRGPAEAFSKLGNAQSAAAFAVQVRAEFPALSILMSSLDITEVIVNRVKPQRTAEVSGDYDTSFQTFNDRMFAARAGEM